MCFPSFVHEHFENFARNACDSKSVSKSHVKEVAENNYTGMDISSLEINEVTQHEGGQMNRPIPAPTTNRPIPVRSIRTNRSVVLVEIHTVEFRGEKYEDMSEGQGIDRFGFFLTGDLQW